MNLLLNIYVNKKEMYNDTEKKFQQLFKSFNSYPFSWNNYQITIIVFEKHQILHS
jgi:hypothetical protein